MSNKTSSLKPVLLAIDDGHSEIKIAFLNKKGTVENFSFPARVTNGVVECDIQNNLPVDIYALSDSDTPSISNSKSFTVLKRGQMGWDGINSARSRDYPVSDRNRILVHHAIHEYLKKSGHDFQGDPVSLIIGTTLPYGDFYIHNNQGSVEKNTQLIEEKKRNLLKPVFTYDHTKGALQLKQPNYSLDKQLILSEGLAAFYSMMFNIDANKNLELNQEFARHFEFGSRFMLVDIGGKTTDVIFGNWHGNHDNPTTEIKISSSLDMGVLTICEALKNMLPQQEEIRGVKISDPESALLQKRIPYYGSVVDISRYIDQCCEDFIQKLKKELSYLVQEESEMAAIIFVGGGTEIMLPYIRQYFDKRLLITPQNSQFANVNGLLNMLCLYAGHNQ